LSSPDELRLLVRKARPAPTGEQFQLLREEAAASPAAISSRTTRNARVLNCPARSFDQPPCSSPVKVTGKELIAR
jgi:hypothetical protein